MGKLINRAKCLVGKHSYYLQFKSESGKITILRCKHCEVRLNIHENIGKFISRDDELQEHVDNIIRGGI